MRPEWDVAVFSTTTCELGEGPLWHPQRQSLFWLDIVNKILYEKGLNSKQAEYDNKWNLPFVSSALAVNSQREDVLWVISEQGFGEFELTTGQYEAKISLPIAEKIRTNDGGVAPNGDFWFGTMEKKPTGQHGSIYSISQTGKLKKQLEHIGIPNTFCWLKNGQQLLLSDSLRQIMLSYEVLDGKLQPASKKIHIDLQQTLVTPDGGAIDSQGNLWNAQWDGGCIACYDSLGHLLQRINLPVPKVSSCCFGGSENKHLFITSANEGMSQQELERYPLSGSIFLVELSVPGMEIKPFTLENAKC